VAATRASLLLLEHERPDPVAVGGAGREEMLRLDGREAAVVRSCFGSLSPASDARRSVAGNLGGEAGTPAGGAFEVKAAAKRLDTIGEADEP
jgi:hypothetical protein